MANSPDRFCSRCGMALEPRAAGGRERPACPACGQVVFGRFSLGVGGLLMHAGRVLLVQRGQDPGRGRWTVPGGYVEQDETPDEAVVREVFEETGLRTRAAELVALRNTLRESDQNAYYIFRLELTGRPEIAVDGTETAQARFFALEELEALPDLAPFSRWLAGHASLPGLGRADLEARLTPLVGTRWALYAAEE